jgi:predicted GIY-YIG superfamily endonuclease
MTHLHDVNSDMRLLKDHLRLQLALIRQFEASAPHLPRDIAAEHASEIHALVFPKSKEVWNGSYVYALELQNGNYYVGMSKNVADRLASHFSGIGALWTRKHPPQRVVEICVGDKDEERRKTLEYMQTYGWQRVRGSNWCRVEMFNPPPDIVVHQTSTSPIVARNCSTHDDSV